MATSWKRADVDGAASDLANNEDVKEFYTLASVVQNAKNFRMCEVTRRNASDGWHEPATIRACGSLLRGEGAAPALWLILLPLLVASLMAV
jgi:hypothetical protein